MRSQNTRGLLLRLLAPVLLLGLITGCEDQDARDKARDAKQAASGLEADLAKMRTELDSLKSQVDSLRGSLQQQVAERMENINKSVLQAQKDLSQKIADSSEELLKASKDQISGVRDDFDQRMKNMLTVSVAESLAKVRDDVQKNREDLLGFMDKQLRELYPYAYQPRRVDPNEPPQAPQE